MRTRRSSADRDEIVADIFGEQVAFDGVHNVAKIGGRDASVAGLIESAKKTTMR